MLWPNIRDLPVHVLPQLATTCQLWPVLRTAERNTILLSSMSVKRHSVLVCRANQYGQTRRETALSYYIWPDFDIQLRSKQGLAATHTLLNFPFQTIKYTPYKEDIKVAPR